MKAKKPTKNKPIVYTYPISLLRKFRNTSAEWKLNWLEEVNNLTNQVLTKKEKEIRNKIRQGLIPLPEQANKFVYEIRKSGKTKGLKIGEQRSHYGKK